jgi:hypothetical protein
VLASHLDQSSIISSSLCQSLEKYAERILITSF